MTHQEILTLRTLAKNSATSDILYHLAAATRHVSLEYKNSNDEAKRDRYDWIASKLYALCDELANKDERG
jgi:hypothetical protein